MRHDWSQTQGFGAEDWSSMCLGRSIWCSAWTCFFCFFCLAVVVIPNHTWLRNNSNSMTPIAYLGVYIFWRFATWRILNPWILWRDTGISTIWYGLVQKCYEYPTFYDKVFFPGEHEVRSHSMLGEANPKVKMLFGWYMLVGLPWRNHLMSTPDWDLSV